MIQEKGDDGKRAQAPLYYNLPHAFSGLPGVKRDPVDPDHDVVVNGVTHRVSGY